MTTGCALVVAKAPVPGAVKTRLAAAVGNRTAAALAAAALLDTLAVCASVFDTCYLALDGTLDDAARGPELAVATVGWEIFPQVSGDLGERLAAAHDRVASDAAGPVVQLGMDTPQVTASDLRTVAHEVRPGTAVLGPAVDGGWWVLGIQDGAAARVLADVPMSTSSTGELTVRALEESGLQVRAARTLRDVDTARDAEAVAQDAPTTRFSAEWRARAVVA